MSSNISHVRLLRYVGLFSWATVGLPLFATFLVDADQADLSRLPYMSYAGWASYFAFGIFYFVLSFRIGGKRVSNFFDYVLLGGMLLCGIGVTHFSATGLGGILLVVASAVIPWILPTRVGLILLSSTQAIIAPLYVLGQGFDWFGAAVLAMVYCGFCAFSFATGLVARQQAEAREGQRRLNAELRATRALLAESVRVNERTRISRELHDLLGHHLTALSLNLEVAGHLTEGKAAGHVRQAHTLAKLLLTDVREAVSQMREDSAALHLASALKPLAENVPNMDIDMQVPDDLVVADPERAHVLLRAVQEIITNAVRHSGASRLRIQLWRDHGMLLVDARDDGRGAEHLSPGNGLRGLSERLRHYQGSVLVDTAPGHGFTVQLKLPLEGSITQPAALQTVGGMK